MCTWHAHDTRHARTGQMSPASGNLQEIARTSENIWEHLSTSQKFCDLPRLARTCETTAVRRCSLDARIMYGDSDITSMIWQLGAKWITTRIVREVPKQVLFHLRSMKMLNHTLVDLVKCHFIWDRVFVVRLHYPNFKATLVRLPFSLLTFILTQVGPLCDTIAF